MSDDVFIFMSVVIMVQVTVLAVAIYQGVAGVVDTLRR